MPNNPLGRNGRKPSPPDDTIRPIIEDLVARGFKNPEIVVRLRDHYDSEQYNISVDVLKKKRSQWGLYSARGQKHTLETIAAPIERLRITFPSIGSHRMQTLLRQEEKISVSRELVLSYMNHHHREDVLARQAHRLARRQFWAAGVNDVWCMDQHDKWRRFELYLHVGLEPFSGRILWLKIWWTNRNPSIVCSWYLDQVERLGNGAHFFAAKVGTAADQLDSLSPVIPLLTQSDRGTENNGVANAQTILRHRQDPSLSHSLQHKFLGDKRNIKPEIALMHQTGS